jgi:putative transposase
MNSNGASSSSRERQRVDRIPSAPALKGHLLRRAPEFYRGRAMVHWTLTMENRAAGWLTPDFHHAWLLVLLHTCARYELVSPACVLMPDHIHRLCLGLNQRGSDQRVAIEFLRKTLRPYIAPAAWQRESYDHVLRDHERDRGALPGVAQYIFENPVRAGLVARWEDYPRLGCCVPGYPEFDVRATDYWDRFWRCYNFLIEKRNS